MTPEETCSSKHKHLTKAEAKATIRKLRGQGKIKDVHSLRSYKCQICGFYHVGNNHGMNREWHRQWARVNSASV